jgi:hypothetical protein
MVLFINRAKVKLLYTHHLRQIAYNSEILRQNMKRTKTHVRSQMRGAAVESESVFGVAIWAWLVYFLLLTFSSPFIFISSLLALLLFPFNPRTLLLCSYASFLQLLPSSWRLYIVPATSVYFSCSGSSWNDANQLESFAPNSSVKYNRFQNVLDNLGTCSKNESEETWIQRFGKKSRRKQATRKA